MINAMAEPKPLKASMLGSKVRYIPLETTDSSLIGSSWRANVAGDKIIIANTGALWTNGERGNAAMVSIP